MGQAAVGRKGEDGALSTNTPAGLNRRHLSPAVPLNPLPSLTHSLRLCGCCIAVPSSAVVSISHLSRKTGSKARDVKHTQPKSCHWHCRPPPVAAKCPTSPRGRPLPLKKLLPVEHRRVHQQAQLGDAPGLEGYSGERGVQGTGRRGVG